MAKFIVCQNEEKGPWRVMKKGRLYAQFVKRKDAEKYIADRGLAPAVPRPRRTKVDSPAGAAALIEAEVEHAAARAMAAVHPRPIVNFKIEQRPEGGKFTVWRNGEPIAQYETRAEAQALIDSAIPKSDITSILVNDGTTYRIKRFKGPHEYYDVTCKHGRAAERLLIRYTTFAEGKAYIAGRLDRKEC